MVVRREAARELLGDLAVRRSGHRAEQRDGAMHLGCVLAVVVAVLFSRAGSRPRRGVPRGYYEGGSTESPAGGAADEGSEPRLDGQNERRDRRTPSEGRSPCLMIFAASACSWRPLDGRSDVEANGHASARSPRAQFARRLAALGVRDEPQHLRGVCTRFSGVGRRPRSNAAKVSRNGRRLAEPRKRGRRPESKS